MTAARRVRGYNAITERGRGSQMSLPSQLGPYEIRARLGAGGMGEVYLAEDTRLKRQVAIKILAR
jgi:serine/threonine protein kinase